MKSKYKGEIWIMIGRELNTNGEEAKDKWTKLRNNHRDALRRQKRMIKSGAATAEIKPWKFQSQMEFLLRYMVNENRETNFTNDDDNSEPTQDQLEEYDNQYSDKQIPDRNEELAQPNTANVEGDNSLDSLTNEPATPRNPKKKVKKTDIDRMIQKTLEKREQRSKERDEERQKLVERITPIDDLHLFFMSMYELTKKMPPSSQHIVRRNVFLTISQEKAHLLGISTQQDPSQGITTEYTHQPMNWPRWPPMPDTCATSSSSVGPPSNSSEGTTDLNLESRNIITYINEFST